ncbi:hook-length control protein FliK [Paracoccus thiocyanatus]|uniref:Hook-length control protein FliK n=1 Tax=Paracoccus thiocyanatus TaxID=34006 RepID=A0A1N6STX3_9RHOB|nr:hook-length control protein FliK [Paracoccus thiocyanatus]
MAAKEVANSKLAKPTPQDVAAFGLLVDGPLNQVLGRAEEESPAKGEAEDVPESDGPDELQVDAHPAAIEERPESRKQPEGEAELLPAAAPHVSRDSMESQSDEVRDAPPRTVLSDYDPVRISFKKAEEGPLFPAEVDGLLLGDDLGEQEEPKADYRGASTPSDAQGEQPEGKRVRAGAEDPAEIPVLTGRPTLAAQDESLNGITGELSFQSAALTEVGGRDLQPQGGRDQAQVFHMAELEPHRVLRQLAVRITPGEAGPIEIMLDPVELGKVRIVISAGETPTVAVLAERPETFDFLKRHAELLEKELRHAGFEGADVSFFDDDKERRRQAFLPGKGAIRAIDLETSSQSVPLKRAMATEAAVTGGIDIRI